MNEPVFFQGGGFTVTDHLLKTPRRTYLLGRIEYVSVTRPLLIFAGGPALGLLGMTAAFRRYLFAGEIATIVGVAVIILAFASLIGTLRVHSLALGGDEDTQTFGTVWRLRQVRAAVERAMQFRNHEEIIS